MKTKVIVLVLVFCNILSINAFAEKSMINTIPERNILDEMKFPSKRVDSKGLVAHYKFDGNLNDSSTYGNVGSSKGNITYVKGKFGEAAKFDGKSYIEVKDNASLDLNSTFTMSVWLYKELNGDSYMQPVVAKGINGDEPYVLNHDAGATLPMITIHGPEDWNSSAPYDLEIGFNSLHMVTITVDLTNKKVNHYINGKLVSQNLDWEFSGDKLIQSDDNLFIGYGAYGGELEFFKGHMDDLRIYNRVLSANEITALYVGETQDQKDYTSIIVTPDKMAIMKEKGILNMNVVGVKADGSREDITAKALYTSSNASVATVDSQGKVVAIAKGTTTITVTIEGIVKQILLTVK